MYHEEELSCLCDLARAGVPLDPAQTIRLVAQVRFVTKSERRLEVLARHAGEALGVHPDDAARDPEALLPRLQAMARERRRPW